MDAATRSPGAAGRGRQCVLPLTRGTPSEARRITGPRHNSTSCSENRLRNEVAAGAHSRWAHRVRVRLRLPEILRWRLSGRIRRWSGQAIRRRRRMRSGSGRRVGQVSLGRGRSARWFEGRRGGRGPLGRAGGRPASRALLIAACRSECGLMWRGIPAAFAIRVTIW